MKKNSFPGLFIVFEGLDSSGSARQAELLAGVLAREGYRVNLTKEPTNSLIGGLIKAHLAGDWQTSLHTLQLLFTADRAQHLNQEIIPKLQAGKIVVCDRYVYSSIAYGSLGIENLQWLKEINGQFISPNITFLVKVRPKICALRIKENHYGLELFREEKKLTKVWETYQKICEDDKNTYLIDGEKDEMQILEEISQTIKKKLGLIKKS